MNWEGEGFNPPTPYGSRTAWVVSIVPWRQTPWVIGVLGRGTDGEVVVVAYSL